jgi:VWFA-related protein
MKRFSLAAAVALAALFVASVHGQQSSSRQSDQDGSSFRFKSGVELINVTATVSDSTGRFVPGLTKDDFVVYEDDRPVEVTHFSAERVPVSLGIVLDTSGSMAGPKIQEAQSALDRFLYDLLDKDDEIFLYRFSEYPVLMQTWTTDRRALSRALGSITPNGGTAMYDAVAEAVPLAEQGHNRKKALVLISDGNDTSSHIRIRELKQLVRESEVLVYAIGIDGEGEPTYRQPPVYQPPRIPLPFPFPGTRGRGRFPFMLGAAQGGGFPRRYADDRVNAGALRELTDDTGGRTEIIRDPRDLNPATGAIADELSKQYYLGYQSSGQKDGRYHSIRVEVPRGHYIVRARKGYVAS